MVENFELVTLGRILVFSFIIWGEDFSSCLGESFNSLSSAYGSEMRKIK